MAIYMWRERQWTPGTNTKFYYEFENNSNDLSGNNVYCSLTQYNSYPVYGEIGGQKYMSGYTRGNINIDKSFFNNKFTLAFYCKIPSGKSTYNYILGSVPFSGGNYGTYFIAYNGKIHIGCSESSNQGIGNPTLFNFTPDSKWHHFIISGNSYCQKNVNLMIDGANATLSSRKYISSSIGVNGLCLGYVPKYNSSTYHANYCFDKVIGENRIWDEQEGNLYFESTKSIYGIE